MTVKDYTELDVWMKSRDLVNRVYSLSKSFPKEEMFGLTNQIRRSAVSVPSNIAEGCGRSSTKDSLHFFYVARGSLYELETQLYVSFDQGYILQEELYFTLQKVLDSKKLLNGFIKYYKSLLN